MPEEKKTKVLKESPPEEKKQTINITSSLSALYEIIRSNPDTRVRKDAATHLLKLIDEAENIDSDEIKKLLDSEKDIAVATVLKRVLNKLKLRRIFSEDHTSKYDKKLSSEEEAKILDEIDRLRSIYDKSYGEKGAFEKKYKVIGKIADGGMGKIYKGIRREDNQFVAIKILLLEELSKENDPDRIVARFKREGEILKRLNHPNIVRGYENGEVDGEYFLVMEYIKGKTVDDMIQSKLINLVTFKSIALQLCDAIEYIHKNGVIHRDIKPSNILIETDKKVTGQPVPYRIAIKLLDFGLSKDKKDSKLSRISFRAGTDVYSSPQQLQDARFADERDDIFSMGKTFYEMLTGKTFKNDEPYEEVSKYNVTAPEEIDRIIKKCIEDKKDNRFQSVSDLKESIKNFS